MPRAASPSPDPAADAAALLRRIGFIALVVVVPLAALLSRRAIVILVPIGVVILCLATVLDGAARPARQGLRRVLRTRAMAAGGVLVAWTALSIVWSPFPGTASERLLNVAITVGLTLAGYLALPDRMRAANAYLLPLGVGIAAIAAVALGLFSGAALRLGLDDDSTLERGAMLLALLVWPAVADRKSVV